MWKSRKNNAFQPICSVAFRVAGLLALLLIANADSQTLNLPQRPAGAMTGTQFTNAIGSTPSPINSFSDRENWIFYQVIIGNVPNWMRSLKPVVTSFSGHIATYYVAPDYLAIGSDTDYFLTPTTPLLAQRLCDRLGCTLPTRKMVGQIWTDAAVKLAPVTFNPANYNILSLDVFGGENAVLRTNRNLQTNSQPLGALVGGDKKDVIISTLIYSNLQANVPKPVVIYGWHQLSPYGVPIQGAVNVHEQTYADYSHGARLVQMNLTVDGGANTVTNVLTSAMLAGLLSDESVAPSFTIPLPRYTVSAFPPVLMIQPRSQSVNTGVDVTFNAYAIGDLPLGYRWLFNGGSIASATNSTLTLTNVSTLNTGNYSVVVTNNVGSTSSRVAILRIRTNSFPVMFADNFDTNSSANWNLFWGATNGIPDYEVDWAYDYSLTPASFNGQSVFIPPAPNSPDGSTRALRLAVNQNDTNAVIAAVSLYPKNKSFSGNFALKFDLWIQYPGNTNGTGTGVAGSTQHGTFGINHLGTNVNWAAPFASASDGLWFGVDGEGGDSKDYRAYLGNPEGTQSDLVALGTSGLTASNNTATVFQNLFPASRFETAGAPGKNWVEVEVRYTNSIVMWLMDGTVIAERNNGSVFTNGNIMIGLMDVFNSIAAPARDSFVLFDNLRVENLTPMPIAFQAAAPLPLGQVALTLTNMPGDNYYLEASTDLTSWQPLASVLATNTTFTFVDTNASAFPIRYYRARR
jgi:hypothetical protein